MGSPGYVRTGETEVSGSVPEPTRVSTRLVPPYRGRKGGTGPRVYTSSVPPSINIQRERKQTDETTDRWFSRRHGWGGLTPNFYRVVDSPVSSHRIPSVRGIVGEGPCPDDFRPSLLVFLGVTGLRYPVGADPVGRLSSSPFWNVTLYRLPLTQKKVRTYRGRIYAASPGEVDPSQHPPLGVGYVLQRDPSQTNGPRHHLQV